MKHILWFVFGFRLVGGFGFWFMLVVGLFTSIIHIPFVLLSFCPFVLFSLFALLSSLFAPRFLQRNKYKPHKQSPKPAT
jgi:hypothetical protein